MATGTSRRQVKRIPVVGDLPPAARIKLRREISKAGMSSLDEFELIALRYFASPGLSKVLREVAALRQQFRYVQRREDESRLLDELDRKRAEKRILIAKEDEAVQKAKSLVMELRAMNLLVSVDVDDEYVRPCDCFPFVSDEASPV